MTDIGDSSQIGEEPMSQATTPPRIFPPLSAAATGSRASPSSHAEPDAELIRICHRFAEAEFEQWYCWEAACDDEDMPPSDRNTYNWIAATPATTPEGWHAKALAYAAWEREVYDNYEAGMDTTFLAPLLRDMVAPARNAIIARCASKYGPLPYPFSAEGIWLGYPPEEKEAMAERPKPAARLDFDEMTREELEGMVPVILQIRQGIEVQYSEVMGLLGRIAEKEGTQP
jgi:hypothetical protein